MSYIPNIGYGFMIFTIKMFIRKLIKKIILNKYLLLTYAILIIIFIFVYLYFSTSIFFTFASPDPIKFYFNYSEGKSVQITEPDSSPYTITVSKYNITDIILIIDNPLDISQGSYSVKSPDWYPDWVSENYTFTYINNTMVENLTLPPNSYVVGVTSPGLSTNWTLVTTNPNDILVEDENTHQIYNLNDYINAHNPNYYLEATFINYKDRMIYTAYSMDYKFNMTSTFLKRTSFSTWECEYYLDGNGYSTDLFDNAYVNATPKQITLLITIPYKYSIKSLDNIKIQNTGNGYIITKTLLPGEIYHFTVTDPFNENIGQLFNSLSLMFLGIILGLTIDKLLK